jgi:hypothetical protein
MRSQRDNGEDRRKRDQGDISLSERAAFYRGKAAECARMAESTTDPTLRESWIEMANGWTNLALHAERLSRT